MQYHVLIDRVIARTAAKIVVISLPKWQSLNQRRECWGKLLYFNKNTETYEDYDQLAWISMDHYLSLLKYNTRCMQEPM